MLGHGHVVQPIDGVYVRHTPATQT